MESACKKASGGECSLVKGIFQGEPAIIEIEISIEIEKLPDNDFDPELRWFEI